MLWSLFFSFYAPVQKAARALVCSIRVAVETVLFVKMILFLSSQNFHRIKESCPSLDFFLALEILHYNHKPCNGHSPIPSSSNLAFIISLAHCQFRKDELQSMKHERFKMSVMSVSKTDTCMTLADT